MALYVIKPVVWNDNGYLRPSGGPFTSGYPAENGFGHEEWNSSDHMTFREGGRLWRIFHTEGLGRQDLALHAGDITIFMIASHKGKQYLVAAAGHCVALQD